MHITKVHLQNFRAFSSIEISLSQGMNVVAGINGSGKTTFLLGTAYSLSPAFDSFGFGTHSLFFFLHNEKKNIHQRLTDFHGRKRFEEQYPVVCSCYIAEGKQTFAASQTLQSIGNVSCSYPQLLTARPLEKKDILPLLVFYRAGRNWQTTTPINASVAVAKQVGRFDGYHHWENAGIQANDFIDWIVSKSLERLQVASERGIKVDEIHDDELAQVEIALQRALSSFHSIIFDMVEKAVLVTYINKNGEKKIIDFKQLSDGERNFICLFADIARRMCLLNPGLGSQVIDKTDGIVLIDELDIHLHPDWQRKIVDGLPKAFPCIQFITTTHSPQVLGEVHRENIVLLQAGQGSSPASPSFGLTSDAILRDLMGAQTITTDVQEKISQIENCIDAENYEQARSLLAALKTEIGEDTEQTYRLHALIASLDGESS